MLLRGIIYKLISWITTLQRRFRRWRLVSYVTVVSSLAYPYISALTFSCLVTQLTPARGLILTSLYIPITLLDLISEFGHENYSIPPSSCLPLASWNSSKLSTTWLQALWSQPNITTNHLHHLLLQDSLNQHPSTKGHGVNFEPEFSCYWLEVSEFLRLRNVNVVGF
jgi:hypothetical protein